MLVLGTKQRRASVPESGRLRRLLDGVPLGVQGYYPRLGQQRPVRSRQSSSKAIQKRRACTV